MIGSWKEKKAGSGVGWRFDARGRVRGIDHSGLVLTGG